MGYVEKGDGMASSYSISHHTFKWMKKLFFHLSDLTILNSYILHSSCGGKNISHTDFRYTIVRNVWHMVDQNGEYQGHYVDHLMLNRKSLGSKSAAANIDLSHLRHS